MWGTVPQITSGLGSMPHAQSTNGAESNHFQYQ